MSPQQLDKFFPGLKQRINGHTSLSSGVSSAQLKSCEAGDGSPVTKSKKNSSKTSKYNQIESFLDPSSDNFAKRLNKSLNHRRTKSMTTTKETKKIKVKPNELFDDFDEGETVEKELEFKRRPRRNCVMCCVHCSSDKPSDNTHNRVGRKMNQFCSVCQVYICDNCWEQFHNSPVLDLPPCVTGKYHLAVQTRSNVPQCTPCPPDVSSPVRVSRPKRDVAGPSRVSNESSNQHMTSTLRGSPIRRQNRQRRARGKAYVADAAAALQISTERRGQPVTSTLRGSPIRKLNRKRGAGGGSDESVAVAALQLLSRTKKAKTLNPLASPKRSGRRKRNGRK